MKCSLGISNFLEEISSLSYSVVFLYFFALIAEEGFLISSCYSLELCIQMLISFLCSFAFRFSFSQLFVRPPRQPFCFFAFLFHGGGGVLIPVSCTTSRTSFHSSSGTLSIRSAAAAAKSLQSCPTLCDPIDGSRSPVPGTVVGA